MTRTLRRNHLIAWLMLAPVVVAVLALALQARPNARLQAERAPWVSGERQTPGVAP